MLLKKIKKINITKKGVMIFLFVVFILSLIPMLYIARYSYPYRDDFTYAAMTHNAFVNTGSIQEVFSASIQNMKIAYNTWQGNFSSVFMFTFNPIIWSEDAFMLISFISFALFISSTLYFSYAAFVKLFRLDKMNWLMIAIVIMFLSIQFIHSPVESFYWQIGAMHYAVFYSLELIFFGLIINYLVNSQAKQWAYLLLLIPIAFFIGGGNYVTALNIIILELLLMIGLLIKKNKKWTIVLIVLAVSVLALSISALAPGNAVRQSRFDIDTSPIIAIVKSFGGGLIYAFTMFNAPNGVLLLIMISLLAIMPLLAKIITNPKYEFKYPILVVAIAFSVFSSQFTPPLYAMGGIGEGRLINIIFFMYIWNVLFVMTYIIGWCYRKIAYSSLPNVEQLHKRKEMVLSFLRQLLKPFLLIVAGIWFCLLCVIIVMDEEYPSTIGAVEALASGNARIYYQEMKIREKLLKSDEKNIVLEPLSVKPRLLYIDDYVDEGIVAFYDKESVVIREVD